MSDGNVLTNSQWNGIFGNGEVHTQRSGCQELHVREWMWFVTVYTFLSLCTPQSAHM